MTPEICSSFVESHVLYKIPSCIDFDFACVSFCYSLRFSCGDVTMEYEGLQFFIFAQQSWRLGGNVF